MDTYIGLDVHQASCTAALMDRQGKRRRSVVLETNGSALVEFVKTLPGRLHVCLEEGTQSGWLYELLEPHVTQIVVAHVGAATNKATGPKDDARDAYALADRLRTGLIEAQVYKLTGPYSMLRMLVKTHRAVTQDTVRVQLRIKALMRSRGVPAAGKEVYKPKARQTYVEALPRSHRRSAEILFEEYDLLSQVREVMVKELVAESHQHPCTRILETVPGLGEIRVAQLVATVVTPERFRTRSQFWSYCGLGIVQRSSSDWVQDAKGRWARAEVQQTRGLNKNHNALLKLVFKGAATTVIQQQRAEEPLYQDYERLLAAGTKPNLAKLTLARKIASIARTVWSRKEVYKPEVHRTKKS